MPLPKSLQFSATSLQDYADCPRRFQLRYLLQVAWPVPEAEPIGDQEHHARLARDFHRLVHQHLLGLPAQTLSDSVHDSDLERWWQAYLVYASTFGDAQIIPEFNLSTPLAGQRVVAQYDALVVDVQQAGRSESTEGRPALLIVDWKTYRQRPSLAWLAQRLQTRVYPLVLVQAGETLFSQIHPEPEDITMCYWLAEYPQATESFVYNTAAYQADLGYLSALITEIVERIGGKEPAAGPATAPVEHEIWPLTTELDRCRFCNYRSLCGRGGTAGPVVEYVEGGYRDDLTADEANLSFDLDWGQVQEIAY